MTSSVINYCAVWLLVIFSVTWGNDKMFEGSDGYAIKESFTNCELLNTTIGNVLCRSEFKKRFHRYTKIMFQLFVQANSVFININYMRGSRVNNHYPFPGANFNVSVCDMLRLNLWESASYMTTDGNITQCPIKPGFYHLTPSNETLGDSNQHKTMPKNIPEGDYKANSTLFINGFPFVRVLVYVSYGPL